MRRPAIQGTLVHFVAKICDSGVGHTTSVILHALAHLGALREHDNRESYVEDDGEKGAPHDLQTLALNFKARPWHESRVSLEQPGFSSGITHEGSANVLRRHHTHCERRTTTGKRINPES